MENIIKALQEIQHNGKKPEILVDCCTDDKEYNKYRKVFNRKFHYRPTAIVLCECTEHVQQALLIAEKWHHAIRVRSGGHDHEGECCGTDTVVIDLSKMTKVVVDKEQGVARIQPGIRFNQLVPELGKHDVCIPHGTCGSVGIAGFTMGGGWGPWTRIHGMCCESLVGATIVLGDGTIEQLSEGGGRSKEELLWALRGGGGMSYGIVTELVIKTFELPPNTIKFNVEWDDSPAMSVLKLWEGLIAPGNNPRLIGTNLMIAAIPKPPAGSDINETVHECTFFGYYAGSNAELVADINIWFADLWPTDITIPDDTDDVTKMTGFAAWDRISASKALLRSARNRSLKAPRPNLNSATPLRADTIPPDQDPPGPHKITCRIVAEERWNDEGRKTLIRSLQSDLVYAQGIAAGIQCYVTLGAITGSYYAGYKDPGFPKGSAFPYKKRPYTIQYQAWWDEGKQEIEEGIEYDVNKFSNRAQDWIEECRKLDFPETSGSFISFKDADVPTRNYFMQSYEQLKKIKETHSKDPRNRFRTRKTII